MVVEEVAVTWIFAGDAVGAVETIVFNVNYTAEEI